MRELKIATAPHKNTTAWNNTLTNKKELTLKAYDPHLINHTVAKYQAMTKTGRDKIKDTGGFVAGHLKNGRRRKGHVLARSFITLDIDNLPKGFDLPAHLHTMGFAWLTHTTISHTTSTPRWRLWVWMSRNTTSDEYEAIARRVAQDINPGLEWFDPTTFQPERFFYWPTTLEDSDYHAHTSKKGVPDLDPDEMLGRYDTWQDATTWPGVTAQEAAHKTGATTTASPLDKPGLIGAFNRAWPLDKAITHFLGDVYKPGTNNRWTYLKGTSANGLIIYNNGGLCFSQHATDPAANGHTHSAFDLVRIHKFGHLDQDEPPTTPANRLPSFVAMTDLAQQDPATKVENAKTTAATIAEVFPQETQQKKEEEGDSAGWVAELDVNKNGTFKDTIGNFHMIFTHDPAYTSISWNQHSGSLEVQDPQALPWEQLKPGWTENDLAMLKTAIAHTYNGLYAPTKMQDALLAAATGRAFHPVRDYFNHLPPWDGVPRLNTLLVDYLGAEDTAYVRAVTRKTLVAAIRRTFQPGTKFDHVLTLVGPQGIGKSTIFARLAGQWFSDNLTLGDMQDKIAAEKLAGNLIIEIPELSGMKKTEQEAVKAFITRTEDKYRPAYGRHVETYPRQCIIVGTTNAQEGFIRDTTGGRRWWAVTVTGETDLRVHDLSQPEVDQIWAEALICEKGGETLYLEGDVLEEARRVQKESIESDGRVGLVKEFLEVPLPANWELLPLSARRAYLRGDPLGEGYTDPGMWNSAAPRTKVSKIEIWSECFGMEPQTMSKRDSHEITSIMAQIDGWVNDGSSRRLAIYGKQRVFERTSP